MSKSYSKTEVLSLLNDPSSYTVPAGEERHYHCIVEVKRFNAKTGERESSPRIQKFGVKEWKDALHNLRQLGYTIIVLHDPNKWLAENAEQLEKEAAKNAEAKKAEAATTQKGAIDEAVRAALAEQQKANAKTLAEMQEKLDRLTVPAQRGRPASTANAGAPSSEEE